MDEKEELRQNLRSALKNLDEKERSHRLRGSLLEIEKTEVEKKKKDLLDEVSD